MSEQVKFELTHEELATIIAEAVKKALQSKEEKQETAETSQEQKPFINDEIKQKAAAAAKEAVNTAKDVLKIAGAGIINAVDELFQAGYKIKTKIRGY